MASKATLLKSCSYLEKFMYTSLQTEKNDKSQAIKHYVMMSLHKCILGYNRKNNYDKLVTTIL